MIQHFIPPDILWILQFLDISATSICLLKGPKTGRWKLLLPRTLISNCSAIFQMHWVDGTAFVVGRMYMPWSNEVKYLGLHFDNWFTHKPHPGRTQESYCLSGPIVSCTFQLSNDLQTKTTDYICTYMLSSWLMYALPLWGHLAAMYKTKLQSIFDRVLKFLKLSAKVLYWFSFCTVRSKLGFHSSDKSSQDLSQLPHWRAWEVLHSSRWKMKMHTAVYTLV